MKKSHDRGAQKGCPGHAEEQAVAALYLDAEHGQMTDDGRADSPERQDTAKPRGARQEQEEGRK